MKKLGTLASLIVLAVALAFAGAGRAAKPPWAGGGGEPSPTVSVFSSPFVAFALDVSGEPILVDGEPVVTGEVDNSEGEINSLGEWSLVTAGNLDPKTWYEICLDAESGPGSTPLPLHLDRVITDKYGILYYSKPRDEIKSDLLALLVGDWEGLRIQIRSAPSGVLDDCSGVHFQSNEQIGFLVQESGITTDVP